MNDNNKNSAVKLTLAILLASAAGLGLGYMASGHKELLNGVSQQAMQKYKIMADIPDEPYLAQSEAGAYLIAQRAEKDSDWPATHRALKNLSEISPLPPEQNARYFLSSIASGDWVTAKKILADHPADIQNSAPLVRMLYAIMQWSDGNDADAAASIKTVTYNPISELVMPFAKGWMTGETPQLNVMLAAQDLGFATINMVRFLEAHKEYDRSDALMIKFQDAELSLRLRVWSLEYFKRRGLTAEIAKAQANLDEITKSLPKETWDNEVGSVMSEADGHLKSPKRALSLTLIDATEFLEANNASAIALLYTQTALKLTPDLTGGELLLASLYDSQGNWAEARAAYGTVAKTNPSYVQAQLRVAASLAEEGRLDDAASVYSKLESAFPKDPEVSFQQGEFYRINRKDYASAIKAYDKVENIFKDNIPDSFWTLYLARGLSYEMLGDAKKAEADYQNAYNLQPDNPEALNTLAYSWAEQGIKLEEAKAMLQRALLANPMAPHITDSYGWILYKTGDPQDALIYLERAISMIPYDMTINDHLGETYWALGRKREARFMWQRALDNAQDDEKAAAKIRAKLNRE